MLYLSENDDNWEETKKNAIPGFLHFNSRPWFGKKKKTLSISFKLSITILHRKNKKGTSPFLVIPL